MKKIPKIVEPKSVKCNLDGDGWVFSSAYPWENKKKKRRYVIKKLREETH